MCWNLRALAISFIILLCGTQAWGQLTAGSVVGTVSDPTGAQVQDATVTITSSSTGSTYSSVTSQQGIFTFPVVPVGLYDFTANAKGFKTASGKFAVELNATRTLNIPLAVGSASETIQVTAAEAPVETTSTQISYTFSHSIDNAPGIFFQDGDHQNSHNLAAERGSSDFDVRHNFVTNVLWDLPFGRNSHGAEKVLVGGWTLTGIYTYQTGVPIYIRVNSDPFNLGCGCFLRPDLVGDPEGSHEFLEWFNTGAFAAPPSGSPRFGTAGRNLVAGPGVHNLDIATYKNFDTRWLGGKSNLFGELSSFQFRAEFYNILNHPQFDQVNGNLTDSAFGQITRARTPRQIQFALKFLW